MTPSAIKAWPIVALILLLAVPAARAQTPQIDRVDVESFGVIVADSAQTSAEKNSPSGSYVTLSGFHVSAQTRAIAARPGTTFGFTYWVIGQPENSRATLRLVVLYPPAGLRNPAGGATFYRSDVDIPRNVGGSRTSFNYNFSGYTIAGGWDTVPGTWTFQLWYQGRMLAEQSFTVTAP